MPTEYEYERECQEIDEEFKQREENAMKGGNSNKMQNNKLEQGEEYLTIQIVGLNKLVAFKNRGKTDPKQPDFVSNGVAIWISKKR